MVTFYNIHIKRIIMAGAWINHVKATHKKLGGSYKDAMKAAAKTLKNKSGAGKKKSPKRGEVRKG